MSTPKFYVTRVTKRGGTYRTGVDGNDQPTEIFLNEGEYVMENHNHVGTPPACPWDCWFRISLEALELAYVPAGGQQMGEDGPYVARND